MKITEIIFEANMSPTGIAQLAAKAGAVCGVEFEMVVPDTEVGSEEQPDYTYNPRPSDLQDIRDFFWYGDYNSMRDIDNALSRMSESLSEFSTEFFAQNRREYFEKWMNDNDDPLEDKEQLLQTMLEENGVDSDLIVEVLQVFQLLLKQKYSRMSPREQAELFGNSEAYQMYKRVKDELESRWEEEIDSVWDNGSFEHDYVQEAYDEWLNDADEQDTVWSDFLDDRGIQHMSDVQELYDGYLTWPYYREDDASSLDQVASDFGEAVGMAVNTSTSYHGATRQKNTWVIEPDGSIDADDGEGGLEFVSPPMPLEDMLKSMKTVIDWAKQRGCYTNRSTGLHMNISLPQIDYDDIDMVKLAVFLGDQYVLEQFGRQYNTYCKSAYASIENRLDPAKTDRVLAALQTSLKRAASMISFTRTKYMSINPHDANHYIEFRSPGGNWLEEDFDKLANTMRRFVAAMYIASQPDLYRNEYLKKLYQLLRPGTGTPFTTLFAQYQAGRINKRRLYLELTGAKNKRLAMNAPEQEYTLVYQPTNMKVLKFNATPGNAQQFAIDWLERANRDSNGYIIRDSQGGEQYVQGT